MFDHSSTQSKQSSRPHSANGLNGYNVIAEPPKARVVGQRISEIDIPEDCPIVSVLRERKLYIAHSFTTIQVGNWHTVLQRVDCVPEFRVKLAQELTAGEEVFES